MAGSYYPSLIAESTSCQGTLLTSGRPQAPPTRLGGRPGTEQELERHGAERHVDTRGQHPMSHLTRSTPFSLWRPPARSRPIPPGRILSRHATAAMALAAALLAGAAPAHAADRLARVVVVERAPASPAAERAVRRDGAAPPPPPPPAARGWGPPRAPPPRPPPSAPCAATGAPSSTAWRWSAASPRASPSAPCPLCAAHPPSPASGATGASRCAAAR